jgi:phospholipase C
VRADRGRSREEGSAVQNFAPRHWFHLAALITVLGITVRPAAAANCGDPTPTTCGAGNVAGCIAGPNRGVSDEDLAKIQHIVVMMQENRSFDHYFGQLHDEGQPDSEAVPAGTSNPNPLNPSGPPITRFHKTQLCEVADLDHSWNGTHKEWNGGAMDGFTAANAVAKDPSGSRTMGYYDSGDLPFYYGLFNTFAIGDRYFCSLLSQTFPNRFYLLAATSFGHIRNDFPLPPAADVLKDYAQKTIFESLDAAGVTWKVYFTEVPFAFLFGYVRQHPLNVAPIAQYFVDALLGLLPQVSFVDPIFLGTVNVENDEHPPTNVQMGELFSSLVITALFKSPQWSSAALFLTYDEHGGFYDHVPPPAACPPDDIPPMLQAGDAPGAFDRYGIRVPMAVVSPFAKSHYVSHEVHDHTSILKFIEARFHLPTLTNRDANADPMLEFFDFSSARFPAAPSLDIPLPDLEKAIECEQNESPPTGF